MGIGVYASVPAGHVGLGTNGTKPGRTEDGSRLLYSEEATQVWFADYGFGKLKGGVATIPIDPWVRLKRSISKNPITSLSRSMATPTFT